MMAQIIVVQMYNGKLFIVICLEYEWKVIKANDQMCLLKLVTKQWLWGKILIENGIKDKYILLSK